MNIDDVSVKEGNKCPSKGSSQPREEEGENFRRLSLADRLVNSNWKARMSALDTIIEACQKKKISSLEISPLADNLTSGTKNSLVQENNEIVQTQLFEAIDLVLRSASSDATVNKILQALTDEGGKLAKLFIERGLAGRTKAVTNTYSLLKTIVDISQNRIKGIFTNLKSTVGNLISIGFCSKTPKIKQGAAGALCTMIGHSVTLDRSSVSTEYPIKGILKATVGLFNDSNSGVRGEAQRVMGAIYQATKGQRGSAAIIQATLEELRDTQQKDLQKFFAELDGTTVDAMANGDEAIVLAADSKQFGKQDLAFAPKMGTFNFQENTTSILPSPACDSVKWNKCYHGPNSVEVSLIQKMPKGIFAFILEKGNKWQDRVTKINEELVQGLNKINSAQVGVVNRTGKGPFQYLANDDVYDICKAAKQLLADPNFPVAIVGFSVLQLLCQITRDKIQNPMQRLSILSFFFAEKMKEKLKSSVVEIINHTLGIFLSYCCIAGSTRSKQGCYSVPGKVSLSTDDVEETEMNDDEEASCSYLCSAIDAMYDEVEAVLLKSKVPHHRVNIINYLLVLIPALPRHVMTIASKYVKGKCLAQCLNDEKAEVRDGASKIIGTIILNNANQETIFTWVDILTLAKMRGRGVLRAAHLPFRGPIPFMELLETLDSKQLQKVELGVNGGVAFINTSAISKRTDSSSTSGKPKPLSPSEGNKRDFGAKKSVKNINGIGTGTQRPPSGGDGGKAVGESPYELYEEVQIPLEEAEGIIISAIEEAISDVNINATDLIKKELISKEWKRRKIAYSTMEDVIGALNRVNSKCWSSSQCTKLLDPLVVVVLRNREAVASRGSGENSTPMWGPRENIFQVVNAMISVLAIVVEKCESMSMANAKTIIDLGSSITIINLTDNKSSGKAKQLLSSVARTINPNHAIGILINAIRKLKIPKTCSEALVWMRMTIDNFGYTREVNGKVITIYYNVDYIMSFLIVDCLGETLTSKRICPQTFNFSTFPSVKTEARMLITALRKHYCNASIGNEPGAAECHRAMVQKIDAYVDEVRSVHLKKSLESVDERAEPGANLLPDGKISPATYEVKPAAPVEHVSAAVESGGTARALSIPTVAGATDISSSRSRSAARKEESSTALGTRLISIAEKYNDKDKWGSNAHPQSSKQSSPMNNTDDVESIMLPELSTLDGVPIDVSAYLSSILQDIDTDDGRGPGGGVPGGVGGRRNVPSGAGNGWKARQEACRKLENDIIIKMGRRCISAVGIGDSLKAFRHRLTAGETNKNLIVDYIRCLYVMVDAVGGSTYNNPSNPQYVAIQQAAAEGDLSRNSSKNKMSGITTPAASAPAMLFLDNTTIDGYNKDIVAIYFHTHNKHKNALRTGLKLLLPFIFSLLGDQKQQLREIAQSFCYLALSYFGPPVDAVAPLLTQALNNCGDGDGKSVPAYMRLLSLEILEASFSQDFTLREAYYFQQQQLFESYLISLNQKLGLHVKKNSIDVYLNDFILQANAFVAQYSDNNLMNSKDIGIFTADLFSGMQANASCEKLRRLLIVEPLPPPNYITAHAANVAGFGSGNNNRNFDIRDQQSSAGIKHYLYLLVRAILKMNMNRYTEVRQISETLLHYIVYSTTNGNVADDIETISGIQRRKDGLMTINLTETLKQIAKKNRANGEEGSLPNSVLSELDNKKNCNRSVMDVSAGSMINTCIKISLFTEISQGERINCMANGNLLFSMTGGTRVSPSSGVGAGIVINNNVPNVHGVDYIIKMIELKGGFKAAEQSTLYPILERVVDAFKVNNQSHVYYYDLWHLVAQVTVTVDEEGASSLNTAPRNRKWSPNAPSTNISTLNSISKNIYNDVITSPTDFEAPSSLVSEHPPYVSRPFTNQRAKPSEAIMQLEPPTPASILPTSTPFTDTPATITNIATTKTSALIPPTIHPTNGGISVSDILLAIKSGSYPAAIRMTTELIKIFKTLPSMIAITPQTTAANAASSSYNKLSSSNMVNGESITRGFVTTLLGRLREAMYAMNSVKPQANLRVSKSVKLIPGTWDERYKLAALLIECLSIMANDSQLTSMGSDRAEITNASCVVVNMFFTTDSLYEAYSLVFDILMIDNTISHMRRVPSLMLHLNEEVLISRLPVPESIIKAINTLALALVQKTIVHDSFAALIMCVIEYTTFYLNCAAADVNSTNYYYRYVTLIIKCLVRLDVTGSHLSTTNGASQGGLSPHILITYGQMLLEAHPPSHFHNKDDIPIRSIKTIIQQMVVKYEKDKADSSSILLTKAKKEIGTQALMTHLITAAIYSMGKGISGEVSQSNNNGDNSTVTSTNVLSTQKSNIPAPHTTVNVSLKQLNPTIARAVSPPAVQTHHVDPTDASSGGLSSCGQLKSVSLQPASDTEVASKLKIQTLFNQARNPTSSKTAIADLYNSFIVNNRLTNMNHTNDASSSRLLTETFRSCFLSCSEPFQGYLARHLINMHQAHTGARDISPAILASVMPDVVVRVL